MTAQPQRCERAYMPAGRTRLFCSAYQHQSVGDDPEDSQIASITPSFRENVVVTALFYTPSAKTTKAIFDDYAGDLSQEEYRGLISKLKEQKFSYLFSRFATPMG